MKHSRKSVHAKLATTLDCRCDTWNFPTHNYCGGQVFGGYLDAQGSKLFKSIAFTRYPVINSAVLVVNTGPASSDHSDCGREMVAS